MPAVPSIMLTLPTLARRCRARPCRPSGGFTLFESIVVIAMLTLVSLGLLSMTPQIFKAQTHGRDQLIGLELMNACAERLLAARRTTGYASVTSTLCNGMGGRVSDLPDLKSFVSNPTVTLSVAQAGSAPPLSVTACRGTTTCTATIGIAKTATPAVAALALITLQLSHY